MKKTAPLKIGILGGGQLARMLAHSIQRLGHKAYILSTSKDDPAAQVTGYWVMGDVKKLSDVTNFLKRVDFVTFESEFVDKKILSNFSKYKNKVFPSARIMLLLQDRLSQKQCLEKVKVPTSRFVSINNYLEFLELNQTFSLPVVIKARFDGYDGKGTYIVHDWTDKKAKEFLINQKYKVIVEEFQSFKRELAISVVRNRNGEVEFFPLVETYQENFQCLWVKGPVKSSKLTQLKTRLKKYITQINYVGLITFELFDVEGHLIVNEVAPRVHNSAHYSQDGLNLDQFMAHTKAIIGMPIEKVISIKKGFAMYNLIGTHKRNATWILKGDASLHWYGKLQNRPLRKMGHINCLGDSPNNALKKCKQVRKGFNI